MGRKGLVWAVGMGLLAACSGGGGSSAATTTTSSATSTTQPTTSTTSPEEAVKAAYLAYWKMIDRIAAAPDPNDPELPLRMVEPRLSSAKDELATEKARGETTTTPENGKYSHVVQGVEISGSRATVTDCSVDDQVVRGADGAPIDAAVTTKRYVATLVLTGDSWKVAESRITQQENGVQSCDG